MENLKRHARSLLCKHIIEPFRCPVSSWKKKGTRAWCFWTTIVLLGASWCFSYALYLTFFDATAVLLGNTPDTFSSFGLFSINENYGLAVKHHLLAFFGTLLVPLHRTIYDLAIEMFYSGIVETCEDEWPSFPGGRESTARQ